MLIGTDRKEIAQREPAIKREKLHTRMHPSARIDAEKKRPKPNWPLDPLTPFIHKSFIPLKNFPLFASLFLANSSLIGDV